MTKALNRCPGGHDRSGYTLGSWNPGSNSLFAVGTATWHGGRTDVTITRPGRTAANEARLTSLAITAPGIAASAGTAACAAEPEWGAGTVPQPPVTTAARHIASPAEMRSIWPSLAPA